MSHETILVVDDSRQIADLVAGKMLPSMGYETLVAYDGRTALDLIRKHQQYIHLILLDLQLPDIEGLEVMRQLESEGINLPIILVTAHGSEQAAADALRLGAQDYLVKPVEPDLLKSAVGRVISESQLRREKAQLNTQLKKRVEWLTVLSNVGRSVTSSLNLEEVLHRIVEAGVYLTQAEEGFLALIEGEGNRLYLRAAKNIDQEKSRTMHLPVNDPMIDAVLRTRKPLHQTRSTAGALLKVSTGFLVHSLLYVPIFSKEKPWGVLCVDNRVSNQAFAEIDDSILTSLADYAAIALENANLFQQAESEITERIRVGQALQDSEERYALAVRGANDGIWDWDFRNMKIYFSPRWKSMLGYEENEIGNDPNEWFSRVHPEDLPKLKLDISAHIQRVTTHFENEHRVLDKAGTYRWMLSRGLAVAEGQGQASHRMAGSQTDITERKLAEEKLYYDAFHDSLTDLPNRALFMERLKQAIEYKKLHPDYAFAVLFLDLDRFKDVNDSLGHSIGDKLLVAIARMLEGYVQPTDTAARIGGDEFAVIMGDVKDPGEISKMADQVQQELTAAARMLGCAPFVTASIGIVMDTMGYNRPEDILRDADIAMYRAKALGRSRHEIFIPAMRDRVVERLALEAELRQAIERNELEVFYQPIVLLETGKIIGLESLVRWHHRERGYLLPSAFIQVAEETGLIIPLDRWVLREACRQMQQWRSQELVDPSLTISVNISSKQFSRVDFVGEVQHILQDTGIPPQTLTLELTERAIMEDFDLTNAILKEMRDIGVQVQIDDFGIGYSSLNCLARFPLNALKVDQAFIGMMLQDKNYLRIVQAIIVMTHGLGMRVIAEGVETEEQLSKLKVLGCEYVQGFVASKALDSEGVRSLLGRVKAGETAFSPWKGIVP